MVLYIHNELIFFRSDFTIMDVGTSILPVICSKFRYFMDSAWDCKLDKSILPVLAQHEPSSTSVNNMIHWSSGTRTGTFCEFDYGEIENLRRYNQKKPPCYNLKKITIPVALFYGNKKNIFIITL